MKYFDSHAHYYDERFESECRGVDELIGALLSSTVSGIVNVGTSHETSRLAIAQAKKYPEMHTALGLHPSDIRYIDIKPCDAISEIRELIINPENKCVALGEIGLDYHYPDIDKAAQWEAFDMQMSLAEELSLPVVIHDREAHGDVMDMIRKHPNVRGILHSYSGSPEMAEELCKRGYTISFSGTLTFTNARKVREVAESVSKDSVIIETDCPYLAPHPHRGKLNHSGLLEFTNRALAEIFKITEEECASLTDRNARRVFGL